MSFNINDIELSDSPREILLAAHAAAAAAAAVVQDTAGVASGEALGFLAGLSQQSKSDVLESTLLAQLAASAKFDRFTQPVKWYTEFKLVLQNVGWIFTEFQFTDHTLGDVAVPVDSIVLDFFKTKLDATELGLIKLVITALETSNQIAAKIFATGSAHDKHANFQLGICIEAPNKNVSLSLGAFTYSTDKPIDGNTLKTELKRGSSTFKGSFQKLLLNEEIYATIRDAIQNKLGNNIKELISELLLPTPRN